MCACHSTKPCRNGTKLRWYGKVSDQSEREFPKCAKFVKENEMEREFSVRIKLPKIRVYLSSLFSFPEVPQNFAVFFSALKISGNSHQSVWSNGNMISSELDMISSWILEKKIFHIYAYRVLSSILTYHASFQTGRSNNSLFSGRTLGQHRKDVIVRSRQTWSKKHRRK